MANDLFSATYNVTLSESDTVTIDLAYRLLEDVPAEMVTVIQSMIILLITAEAFLSRWRYGITVREAAR
jgi:ABC-type uncharacterized transport system permease subunit